MTQRTDLVKVSALLHQVVERTNHGLWVVAAFDTPEAAEAFASLSPARTVRVKPEHVELERYARELRRPPGLTEPGEGDHQLNEGADE